MVGEKKDVGFILWAVLALVISAAVLFGLSFSYLSRSLRDFPSPGPRRETVEPWNRETEPRCRAFWDSGHAVDVPADLADKIKAGMRDHVSGKWGSPSLTRLPGELLAVRETYAGQGTSPEDAWMVRLDADEYLAKLTFDIREVDNTNYRHQTFVVVRGPLDSPESISWLPTLTLDGSWQKLNPTQFEAEPSSVEIPREINECSRVTAP